jgi:hypothetical protein
MTIVREEENGNNGHHAGGLWRGRRCSLSLDTRAGALARVGRIDRISHGSISFGVVGPKQVELDGVTRRLWNFLSLASGVWKPTRVGDWMTDTWVRPAPARWARAVPVPVVSRHFSLLAASTSASILSSSLRGSSLAFTMTAAIFVVLWM